MDRPGLGEADVLAPSFLGQRLPPLVHAVKVANTAVMWVQSEKENL